MIKKTIILLVIFFCRFTFIVCGEKNILANLTNSPEPVGAGAAWKKNEAGAAWEKNQEPEPLEKKSQEPEPLEKKSQEPEPEKNLPAPQPWY